MMLFHSKKMPRFYKTKKAWGNATLRYDEEKQTFWSISKTGKVVKYYGLATYGVERKPMPENK